MTTPPTGGIPAGGAIRLAEAAQAVPVLVRRGIIGRAAAVTLLAIASAQASSPAAVCACRQAELADLAGTQQPYLASVALPELIEAGLVARRRHGGASVYLVCYERVRALAGVRPVTAAGPRAAAMAGLVALAGSIPELCNPRLGSRGLSPTCVRVMAVVLAEQAERGRCRISQAEIAGRLGCHPGSIGPVVRRLERAGVLHRTPGAGRIPDTLTPDVGRLALHSCSEVVAAAVEGAVL